MSNVKTEVQGDTLVIKVDISAKTKQSAPLSKSGKSRVVASTNGFLTIGDVKIGLNVIH